MSGIQVVLAKDRGSRTDTESIGPLVTDGGKASPPFSCLAPGSAGDHLDTRGLNNEQGWSEKQPQSWDMWAGEKRAVTFRDVIVGQWVMKV